jgi:hypothetical protein
VPTFDEAAVFIREQTAYRGPLTETTTLQSDIGVYGDDLGELLNAYAERFGVDLAGYLWYFHTGEEGGPGIGGLFFPPPNVCVQEIPITLGMLREFAEQGRWAVEYPPHEHPWSRPDLCVNRLVALVFLAGMVLAVVLGCI